MTIVDASVVVDWVVPGADPASLAMRVLEHIVVSGADVEAPRLLLEEVSNALLTGVRRHRWSGAEADMAFVRLGEFPVRLIDDRRDLGRAWELSRRYDNHPVYDMVYVATAERAGRQLITADRKLLSLLRGVPWVSGPEDLMG